MPHILIVEDEPDMLRGLKDNLTYEHYDVDSAADGLTAVKKISSKEYDLIILDIMLPKLSGMEVCRKVREQGITTPIIMLTAKGEEVDRVLGLELGADDYVTKPFGVRELLARMKAILRRSKDSAGTAAERTLIGAVELDFSAYSATRKGKPLALTPKEFDILKYLWAHRNKTVSRDELLTRVWGYEESISTRTVDNFMLKLRQKIEDDPSSPKHIITIHGIGYKLLA